MTSTAPFLLPGDPDSPAHTERRCRALESPATAPIPCQVRRVDAELAVYIQGQNVQIVSNFEQTTKTKRCYLCLIESAQEETRAHSSELLSDLYTSGPRNQNLIWFIRHFMRKRNHESPEDN